MRLSAIIQAILLCTIYCRNATAADRLANWDGTTGNWSDATKWLITPAPNEPTVVPNNGNGGFTYDVDIDTGGVILDVNAQLEHLLVGDPQGTAGLTISNGRTLSTNANARLGDSTLTGFVERGFGSVDVTGTGSTWNNTGSILLGAYGTGNLNVSDGGLVISATLHAGAGTFIVTPTLRGTGNVTVTGLGSRLSMTNALNIGNSLGFGNLTVDALASVTAPSLNLGTRGSLRIDFGSSPPAAAPLTASTTATLAGTLRVSLPETPQAGDYSILDYEQLTGQFSNVSVEGIAASEYTLDYGSGTNDRMMLTVAPKPKTEASIYWTDSLSGVVRRANLDGSAIQTIINGIEFPIGIDVDPVGQQIYWGAGTENQIERAGLDGSGVQNVAASGGDGDVAVDSVGGKIYWTNPFSFGSIERANLDGSGIETIVDTGSGVRGIALDLAAGKLYWTDYISNTVNRANLDGSEQETIVTDQSNPMNIALDTVNGQMYWSDNGFQQIRSANFDGSDIHPILNVSSSSGIIDIALDGAGSIYWTQNDCCGSLGQIMRAYVDGTNIQAVVQMPNAVIRGLAIFDPLPGDFNGDGNVDAADYVVWRKYGGNQDSYNAWRANFGRTLGGGVFATNTSEALTGVPEPATWMLVALAGVVLMLHRAKCWRTIRT